MGKIRFSEAEQKVVDVLKDKKFHCLAAELAGKMVDYRARITQKGAIKDKLEERGYTVEGIPCTFHNHKGNVHMRRIVPVSSYEQRKAAHTNPVPSEYEIRARHMVALFDAGKPAQEIFAV